MSVLVLLQQFSCLYTISLVFRLNFSLRSEKLSCIISLCNFKFLLLSLVYKGHWLSLIDRTSLTYVPVTFWLLPSLSFPSTSSLILSLLHDSVNLIFSHDYFIIFSSDLFIISGIMEFWVLIYFLSSEAFPFHSFSCFIISFLSLLLLLLLLSLLLF